MIPNVALEGGPSTTTHTVTLLEKGKKKWRIICVGNKLVYDKDFFALVVY